MNPSPNGFKYIPNFISEEDEERLLKNVYAVPQPQWKRLNNRRLINLGGVLTKTGLIPCNDIPAWLDACIDRVVEAGCFPEDRRPNHVLVNEYLPRQGIMPHTDGPLYFPVVTTLSLGSHTLLDFYSPLGEDGDTQESAALDRRFVGSLLLEPRSLVVITDELYSKYLHGIAERTEDLFEKASCWNASSLLDPPADGSTLVRKSARVSLTIRNIPRVARCNLSTMIGSNRKD